MVVSRDGKELATAFCLDVARIAPMERMDMVRRGVAPIWLGRMAAAMGIAVEHLMLYLGLDRRVVAARLADGSRLDPHDAEAVVATAKFVGDAMLLSGLSDPDTYGRGVDVAGQLGIWLRTPTADLEYRAPIQYLDTVEGRALTARLWIEQRNGQGCPRADEKTRLMIDA